MVNFLIKSGVKISEYNENLILEALIYQTKPLGVYVKNEDEVAATIETLINSGYKFTSSDTTKELYREAAKTEFRDVLKLMIDGGFDEKYAWKYKYTIPEIGIWARNYINSKNLSTKLKDTLPKKSADTKIRENKM